MEMRTGKALATRYSKQEMSFSQDCKSATPICEATTRAPTWSLVRHGDCLKIARWLWLTEKPLQKKHGKKGGHQMKKKSNVCGRIISFADSSLLNGKMHLSRYEVSTSNKFGFNKFAVFIERKRRNRNHSCSYTDWYSTEVSTGSR